MFHCWHRFGLGGRYPSVNSGESCVYTLHSGVFFIMNGLGGDVQCINNLNVYPLVNRVDADFSTCLLDELV